MCRLQESWLLNVSQGDTVDVHHGTFVLVCETFSLVTIISVALLANTSVMVAILTDANLRRSNYNLLIINLNFTDLCSCLGSMTFSLVDLYNEGYLLCYPSLCQVRFVWFIEVCGAWA